MDYDGRICGSLDDKVASPVVALVETRTGERYRAAYDAQRNLLKALMSFRLAFAVGLSTEGDGPIGSTAAEDGNGVVRI
jgi:hypothetical protein